MSALGPYLRSATGGVLMFWCPGCDSPHQVWIGSGPGPRWGYNGNDSKPTFTPSILVTWPANPKAAEEFKEWRTERTCHSYVTDGRIQFLSDCWHSLAGQTVPLPRWDEHLGEAGPRE